MGSLEKELCAAPTQEVGRSHGLVDHASYNARIEAVNFALTHDDGIGTRNYHEAEIILVGLSRSGKTPTCVYLALQFGIRAANYPITEEDLQDSALPKPLHDHRAKLFGLAIDAYRLQRIRTERKPNSRYASLQQCRLEVNRINNLFKHENIRSLDTTTSSVEEIATIILDITGLERHLY